MAKNGRLQVFGAGDSGSSFHEEAFGLGADGFILELSY